ncbi:MAG: hypothetical protein GXO54_04735 [Chloroflexi bacterium]|nr:hypothetical protein [Chloroflexota bacterium]
MDRHRLPLTWRWWIGVGFVAGVSLALKGVLIATDQFPLHGDEAVVLLMARHILQGERPIYFYGQAYMGSLDAYLIALGFALLGEATWVARLVQGLLYAAVVSGTMVWVRRHWGGQAAFLTGLLLAFPPLIVTLYTTSTRGGYNEALLLGTLGLLWATRPGSRGRSSWHAFFDGAQGGVLLGLGWWIMTMSWLYLVPATGLAWWRRGRARGRAMWWALGLGLAGLVAAGPWWLYSWQHGWRAYLDAYTGQGMPHPEMGYLSSVLWHLGLFFLFGIPAAWGLRPPWSAQLLVPWLAPVVVAAHGLAWYLWWRIERRTDPGRLVLAIAGANAAAFVFTRYGADPSGRYFLPLAHMSAIVLGRGLVYIAAGVGRRLMAYGLASAVISHALLGIWTVARPPGPFQTVFQPYVRVSERDLRLLQQFLLEHGERYGFAHYWIAYPLAFISQEQLIFSPRLPYHADLRYTPRDDRYPLYTCQVLRSPRVTYITDGPAALDERLVQGFQQAGIRWREAVIGSFRVYYDLSRPIMPWELGLSPRPEVNCAP